MGCGAPSNRTAGLWLRNSGSHRAYTHSVGHKRPRESAGVILAVHCTRGAGRTRGTEQGGGPTGRECDDEVRDDVAGEQETAAPIARHDSAATPRAHGSHVCTTNARACAHPSWRSPRTRSTWRGTCPHRMRPRARLRWRGPARRPRIRGAPWYRLVRWQVRKRQGQIERMPCRIRFHEAAVLGVGWARVPASSKRPLASNFVPLAEAANGVMCGRVPRSSIDG